ncbi:hypothetical protein GCM10010170_043400 [Dactylosporangium salmoneum]|uniref:Uncharacterized protein n=1 Tax=Dactylosporangium salmoneum TaxID=53361 RepID=A0ABP5TIZ7_9ACTN
MDVKRPGPERQQRRRTKAIDYNDDQTSRQAYRPLAETGIVPLHLRVAGLKSYAAYVIEPAPLPASRPGGVAAWPRAHSGTSRGESRRRGRDSADLGAGGPPACDN